MTQDKAPEWAEKAARECLDGYLYGKLSPDEAIALALSQAYERGQVDMRERAATSGHFWLTDWASDLAATWEAYIEAKRTGMHGGRRISPENADLYAKQFRERAEAVAGCADHVAEAIRSLPIEQERKP